MQYLSSFSDLGTISKNAQQAQTDDRIDNDKLYEKLVMSIKDTTFLKEVKKILNSRSGEIFTSKMDSAANEIILLKDSISNLKENLKDLKDSISGNRKPSSNLLAAYHNKIQLKEKCVQKYRKLRRTIKVPAEIDFSGIGFTTFSYFKFAVIVSFLAFIFGYDHKLFTDFISRFSRFSDQKSPKQEK